MIRLSRQTDYGIVLMSQLAAQPEVRRNANELAEATHLPAPMVAKILKQLVRSGLLISRRGAHGGYALAQEAASISVADIIAALDGPIAMTECVEESTDECSYEATCRVRGNWLRINRAVRESLEAIPLSEMAYSTAPGAPAEPDLIPLLPMSR